MSKKQMTEALQTLFGENPNETYNFKYIFKALKLDTHPLKMLAMTRWKRWHGTTI